MRRGRGRPPVLAEIGGPASGDARAWSLRRSDLAALAPPLAQLAKSRRVLLTGEGRLPAAIALAAAASAAGRRTALLECDLAEPALAAELGLVPAPGLHEYLRWEATAAEILRTALLAGPAAAGSSEALVVVPAGGLAADPATPLGLDSFRHAVAKLSRAYDLVVLIGPPLDAPAGALEAAAGTADAVLLAVPSGRSGRPGRAERAALRRLAAPRLGTILLTRS